MATSSRWKKFFGSKWFLILGTAFFAFLFVGYVRMYYQNYLVNKEISRLQVEAQRVRAKKLEVLELLEYSKSPAFVEQQARLQLNMVKDGEHVLIVNKSPKKPQEHSGQKNEGVVESDKPSNALAWWQYFFN